MLRISLLGVFILLLSSCGSDPMIGKAAPPLSGAVMYNDTEHESFNLEQYRGKAVLVDFWATWCGPCVQSIPELVEWHETYADQGLVIVGLTDNSSNGLEAFLDEHQIPYRIAVTDSLGNNDYGIESIPHLVLIGKDGKVIKRGHPSTFSNADIEGAL